MSTLCRLLLPLLFASLAAPLAAAAEHHQSARPDGTRIDWQLDRLGPAPQGLLVIAQGSGCEPVAALSPAMLAFSELAPGHALLLVEKYAIDPAATSSPGAPCPAEFLAGNSVSQRVADLEAIIAELEGQPWWNGELVLAGGSEGGTIAAILAARLKPTAVVLVSSGGGIPFGELVRATIPEEGWPSVDATFAEIRAAPASDGSFGGLPYHWWADIMDRRIADELLQVEAPILLVQGGSDPLSPTAAARATADLFAAAGRCNLTYWEFPTYDHAMRDPAGSHMPEIVAAAATWLGEQSKRPGGCEAAR